MWIRLQLIHTSLEANPIEHKEVCFWVDLQGMVFSKGKLWLTCSLGVQPFCVCRSKSHCGQWGLLTSVYSSGLSYWMRRRVCESSWEYVNKGEKFLRCGFVVPAQRHVFLSFHVLVVLQISSPSYRINSKQLVPYPVARKVTQGSNSFHLGNFISSWKWHCILWNALVLLKEDNPDYRFQNFLFRTQIHFWKWHFIAVA